MSTRHQMLLYNAERENKKHHIHSLFDFLKSFFEIKKLYALFNVQNTNFKNTSFSFSHANDFSCTCSSWNIYFGHSLLSVTLDMYAFSLIHIL